MARHVHADKMIEAAEDTNIKWQRRNPRTIPQEDFYDCSIPSGGVVLFIDKFEYRKKPREFQEGHWYPMTDKEEDSCVKLFSDGAFHSYDNLEFLYPIDEFKWIGESLGELKFGE